MKLNTIKYKNKNKKHFNKIVYISFEFLKVLLQKHAEYSNSNFFYPISRDARLWMPTGCEFLKNVTSVLRFKEIGAHDMIEI